MSDIVLSILARWPEPGAAKTRLIPDFGPDGAARIYEKLLTHTIAVASNSGIPFQMRITGASVSAFKARFGEGLEVVDQGSGDLTDKLSLIEPPAIVIGSDCPDLTVKTLWAAHDALAKYDAVIGPASDGGYYLIGYRQEARFAFADMPWSTAEVFEQTLRRFVDRGLSVSVLPELCDIDTAADLEVWPEFLP